MHGIEAVVDGLQVAALHEVVALAVREVGQLRLGALGVDEDVGLVGAAIHGGTAELGEPERLGLRHPGRGRGGFDAAGAVEMLVEPPRADVLEAEHPRLAEGGVGDGRADLGGAVGRGGVVPVVALAGDEVSGQVGDVVDGGGAGEAIEVGVAVAPVRERPVHVDADGVDGGRGPQRVEVEIDVAGAVGGLVAEVFRPIGDIRDLGARGGDHGFNVGGEIAEGGDEGVGGGAVAHRGEAYELGADDEGVDAAGGLGEVGVVQDEAAVGPLRGTGVGDALIIDGEVGRVRGADEGGELGGCGGGLVGGAGLAKGGRDGDAAAPGIGGLAGRAGVGIGEGVSGGNVHQEERRQRDGEAAGLEVLDGGDDGLIGGRAAVGSAAFHDADEVGLGAVDAGDAPGERLGDLVGEVHAGADLAVGGAQIGAEPGDDEIDRGHVGKRGLELVEGDGPVAALCPPLAGVHILGEIAGGADLAGDGLGRIDELARARDERHGADARCERIDGAGDLEGELRNAVAEGGEREALEHDVGCAAVGGRVAGALAGLDQAVGGLRLAAGVEAVGEGGEVELDAVGPDAADAGDLAL
jgi:hypothetical protein